MLDHDKGRMDREEPLEGKPLCKITMDVIIEKRKQKVEYKHHDQHLHEYHYKLWSRLETIDASQYVSKP